MTVKNSKFNSEHVITEHISDADFRAYFVGFDLGLFRYDKLVDKIMDALVDFAFGYHDGILTTSYQKDILKEAAVSIYNIPEIQKVKEIYIENDSELPDDIENKYLRRGEFGELILHLILSDFIHTVPLISKIYFKDSDSMTVHGFDAVHIGNDISSSNEKSLFLGESKLYTDAAKGVTELLKDVENHFEIDFLSQEFALIGKKRNAFLNIEEYTDLNTKNEYESYLKEKDFWYSELDKVKSGERKMQDLFKSVTVPLLCTYTSQTFNNHNDENSNEFRKEHENEVSRLKAVFDKKLIELKSKYNGKTHPVTTNLNIVLMLFPVPSKKELVKKMHEKLLHAQKL